MTPYDFLAVLAQDLRLQGEPFSRDELQAWVASMWPLITDDPNAVRWAGEFLDRYRADVPTALN
jgi:hypothetical protein